jgi:hypothetical protein
MPEVTVRTWIARVLIAVAFVMVGLTATASAQPAWLTEINMYRAATGLAPVSDEPAWDVGIEHHLTYLEKTPSSYFTGQYQSAHTENPASPYYTSEGATEAGYSDLDEGEARSALQAVGIWLAAPFHAVGMLRAQLTQVALADDPKTGYAGLDVIQGLDYALPAATTPILFPGPGVTTDLVSFAGESPDPLETCGWSPTSGAGLPLIVLLAQAPAQGLTATLSGPDGVESTGNGQLCVVDEFTYHSSDPVYGPTGAAILQGDNAVFLIPRRTLTTGTYSVSVVQAGQPDIDWSFSAVAPVTHTTILGVHVHGHRMDISIATPHGTELRCALFPRTEHGLGRASFHRCAATTVYRHVAAGRYRLTVESSAGDASRQFAVG